MLSGPYKRITEYPYYEINSNGIVRRIFRHHTRSKGSILHPHVAKQKVRYVLRNTKWISHYVSAAKLLRSAWGLDKEFTPEWANSIKGLIKAHNQRLALDLKKESGGANLNRRTRHQAIRGTKSRRCHDCDKPTNNYRCSECWEKLLSEGEWYGPEDPHSRPFSKF